MHSILIVDDYVPGCRALSKLLEQAGERAICVDSGELALAYLRKHIPKLVILDISMPVMDGLQVLDIIRGDERLKNMPVIMFSALDDPPTQERARRAGANDYWVKSRVTFEMLEEMIAPYLSMAS